MSSPSGLPQTARGSVLPNPPDDAEHPLTVDDLVLGYWTYVQKYYRKNGKPTSEVDNVRQALRFVVSLYGQTPAKDFGPKALKAVRESMVVAGRCRTLINKDIFRIRAMFRWAAENELLSVTIHLQLCAVVSLSKGRSQARETKPVKPVLDKYVASVKRILPAPLQAMVEVQLLTGMRPGEVTIMRTGDLDRSGDVWFYTPESHKTEHHDIRRLIAIGPKAQAVLRPWLREDQPWAYLFNPREVMAARDDTKRNRGRRAGSGQGAGDHPMIHPGDHYRVSSYRQLIQRACRRAKVPVWRPNQLRHNAATAIRKTHGIEGARVVLGHQSPTTSEIYADKDRDLAATVMREMG